MTDSAEEHASWQEPKGQEATSEEASSIIIGIDLGTTNTVVAAMKDNEPTVLPNAEGKLKTPSIVAFTADDQTIVGETAQRQMVTNPKRSITAVKRLMGHFYTEVLEQGQRFPYDIAADEDGKVLVDIDGAGYAPQQISSLLLRKMKDSAEEALGQEVTKAIITVPAYFDDLQRQATMEAGEMAGLEVLRLINEPTAAAMAFGLGRNFEGVVAVYDFGGGTFDISLLEVMKNSYEVLTTTGDSHLGGEDIDFAIMNYLADAFMRQHDIDLREDAMSFRRLKDAAEQAKCELSTAQQVQVSLPFIAQKNNAPLHLELVLKRSEIEKLIEPLARRTLDCCQRALKEAGLRRGRIDKAILVGGSTRIPLVQEMVENFFNQAPFMGVNPDEIVALGAATQGSVMAGQLDDVVLLEVTPHSLGIEIKDGRFSKIIDQNSTIPIKASKAFTTTEDFQEFVNIHVLQGEDDFVQNNRSLGKFTLSNINPMKANVPRIEVAFFINSDGIVEISATDVLSGKGESLTVHHSYLSDEEFRDMQRLESARRKRASTGKKRASAGGAQLESQPVSSTEATAEAEATIPGRAFEEVKASADALEALEAAQVADGEDQERDPTATLSPQLEEEAPEIELALTETPSGKPADKGGQLAAAETKVEPKQQAAAPAAIPDDDDEPPTLKEAPLAKPAPAAKSKAKTAITHLPPAVVEAEELLRKPELDDQDCEQLRATIPAYAALAREHPEEFSIPCGMIKLYTLIHEPHEALRLLEEAEERFSGHGKELLGLYNKLLRHAPRFAPGLKGRGALLERLGHAEQSLADYERALTLTASDGELMRKLHKIYEGKLKERADPTTQFNLIKIHLKKNEIDEAVVLLQQLVNDPTYGQRATKILGLCFWQKHMYYLAFQKFKTLPVTAEIKDILYRLSTDMEAADQLTNSRYALERIYAMDINYRDVAERIEKINQRIKRQQDHAATGDSSSQPGRILKDSRFTVLEELNRGSMGIIFRARDKVLDEIVALKILNDCLCSDPEAVERFKREARAAKRLSHPNIVRIHDLYENAGKLFISMEYIEGIDLKGMLRERKNFAWKEISQVVFALCGALKYAHKLNIVHRDIKPANIMLTDGNEVRITDFGIAKILTAEDLTRPDSMVMGTPLYMAPEQVEGGKIDFRTDIYALGAMLFEMLSGAPPYQEGNIEYQHVHAEIPALPPTIAQQLADVIYKCLAKKQDDRFKSVKELEIAFRALDEE